MFVNKHYISLKKIIVFNRRYIFVMCTIKTLELWFKLGNSSRFGLNSFDSNGFSLTSFAVQFDSSKNLNDLSLRLVN